VKPTELMEKETTGEVIRVFFRVYDRLGYGFLESVYAKALAHELTKTGVPFAREAPVDVWYDGASVGRFRTDFVVRDRVVVELKSTEVLSDAHRKQVLNLLRSSSIEVGLLLHFGPRASFERIAYSNGRKTIFRGERPDP
jgi:GxxExxY protein